MKEAYLSFVFYNLTNSFPLDSLRKVDSDLRKLVRQHEIIMVTKSDFDEERTGDGTFECPVTLVSMLPSANENAIRISALARASGDFIVEWVDDLDSLNIDEMSQALQLTNQGVELIEFVPDAPHLKVQTYLRVINSFRPVSPPLQHTFARLMSRRALSQVLQYMNFPLNPDIALSDLVIKRAKLSSARKGHKLTVTEWGGRKTFSTLVMNTRFGGIFPIILSAISSAFGLGMAIFAASLFIVSGKSPEGWTTLMVVTGFGIGSILALLGMIWMKLESIFRALTSSADVTSEVKVIAPTQN